MSCICCPQRPNTVWIRGILVFTLKEQQSAHRWSEENGAEIIQCREKYALLNVQDLPQLEKACQSSERHSGEKTQPFSQLRYLCSPQLMRMAFETVIKCLRSTLPLHYSQIPVDHILARDRSNILDPKNKQTNVMRSNQRSGQFSVFQLVDY